MLKQQRFTMVCALLLWALAPNAWSAETTFKTLLNLDGTNGAYVFAPLIQGLNGNLYGVASGGGKNNGGTVFEITPEGKLTTLYNFCSKAKCADGSFPEASLVLATNGNFYGTTKYGGVCGFSGKGCGTVFEITPAGKLTTLHTFCAKGGEYCSDGANPDAPLIQNTNGDLYGTTFYGGNSNDAGTLFEITSEGQLTTLYTFCSKGGEYCTDGANPQGPMALARAAAADGADSEGSELEPTLYGTTDEGGAVHEEGSPCGDGLVWVKDPGDEPSEDYWYCSSDAKDGADPMGLIYFITTLSAIPGDAQSTSPTFAGTTAGGGANLSGVVYKITASGAYTLLHNFCSEAKCADGAYPAAPPTEGTDGNLYGTTNGGNGNAKCPTLNGCGTAYKITPKGALTTLHSFKGSDGEYPWGGLVQATNGTFYGTTEDGGASGQGTIFSISVGLGPFVQAVPTIGAVGSGVMVLGTDLTGTTSVTFNGKAATFKVVSATEITATVPSGATTGTVEVKTPGGTLESWPFQVL